MFLEKTYEGVKQHTYDASTLEAEQEKSLNQAQPLLYGTVKWGEDGERKKGKKKASRGKKNRKKKGRVAVEVLPDCKRK